VIVTPDILSTECQLALSDLLQVPVDHVVAAWNAMRTSGGYDWHLLGDREISVPVPVLSDLQRQILDRILRTGPVSPAAYAGVPGRSYVAAAWRHLGGTGAETAVLDIADAFGSTTYGHVRAALSRRLKAELWVLGLDPGDSKVLVQVLAHLVTVDRGGRTRQLPLGSPTSVAMFNLILLSLDGELARWCKPGKVTYTRYVDDMVFSRAGGLPVELEATVHRAVLRHGFRLNPAKTVRRPAGHGAVHGLVRVAEGIVPSERARERFASNIGWHSDRAADTTSSAVQRQRSRGFLKGLDTYLQQFYERQEISRPGPLEIRIPAGAAVPPPAVDLLWD
jgi:hypothetical protein